MKHLKLFQTLSEYDLAALELPNITYILENEVVNFHPYVDYASKYLTFEAIEDSTFKLTQNACEYSLDEGETWVSLSANTNTPTVPAGNKILFKATNPSISSNYGIGTFSSSGKFNVSGNIMSMLYGDGFVDKNDLTGKDYAFLELFCDTTSIIAARNLALPATTLANRCYKNMFENCSLLTTAPELPAMTLAKHCYSGMFNGCGSLTTAPVLPATTLVEGCYSTMFVYCTSLMKAPELPATTLVDDCYNSMFSGCTSLTTAPELPATTLAENCYSEMFSGCESLTTAPELPATTLAESCYVLMFADCTNLVESPLLRAKKLISYCYTEMFYGCSKLNLIKMLATDVSEQTGLIGWVDGVSPTGTFVKHPDMTSLLSGINGIPEGWTVEDYQ